MKRALLVLGVVAVLAGLVYAGLWTHARTVETGEAERTEIGLHSDAGAHRSGDVLILPDSTRQGEVQIYSLSSERLLHSIQAQRTYVADGPIAAVLRAPATLTGIDDDGQVAWTIDENTELPGAPGSESYDSYWPDAADAEGTVVARACRGQGIRFQECDMIAVTADDAVRWQAETATDFPITPVRSGSVRGADASIPLSEVALDIVYDPESGWPAHVRVFSFQTGEATVLGDQLRQSNHERLTYHGRASAGLSEPVNDEEGAAEADEPQCTLALFNSSGEEFGTLTHSCAVLHRGSLVGEYVDFGSVTMLDWVREEGLDPRDESGFVHVHTGQWVPSVRPGEPVDEVIPSAAGLIELVDGTWHWSGVSDDGEAFQRELPVGYEPVAFGSDAVAAAVPVTLWSTTTSESSSSWARRPGTSAPAHEPRDSAAPLSSTAAPRWSETSTAPSTW